MQNHKTLIQRKAWNFLAIAILIMLLPFFLTVGCGRDKGTGPVRPKMVVNPKSLSFVVEQNGSAPVSQHFSINSPGEWSVDERASWLSVTPKAGVNGNTDINVSILNTKIKSGTYSAKIAVECPSAANSPETVEVSYQVLPNEPYLVLSASSLNFRAKQKANLPTEGTFTITNGGGGVLNWNIRSDSAWLDISPTSGSNSATVLVSPNTTDLEPGTYTASISLDGNFANKQKITVTYIIDRNPPKLIVNPTYIALRAIRNEGKPNPVSLTITNGGGNTLHWSITVDGDWLDVDAVSGSNESGTSTTLSLQVNTTLLHIGNYQATITVNAPGADNSPQQVSVLYQLEGPHIAVDHPHIKFTALQGQPSPVPSKWLWIRNEGKGTLKWQTLHRRPWLDIIPSSGQGDTQIELRINTTNLDPGIHTDTIVVVATPTQDDADNSAMVIVEYEVIGPSIQVEPASLTFSACQQSPDLPNSQTLQIWNGGGGVLNWKIDESCQWLEVTPMQGTGTSQISVSVNTTDLDIRSHPAEIWIRSKDDSDLPARKVTVTYVMNPKPHIELDKHELHFVSRKGGPPPEPQDFKISNTGNCALEWCIRKPLWAFWISVQPSCGTGDSNVQVSVDPWLLGVGTHTETIQVESSYADNSPQLITIIYEVLP